MALGQGSLASREFTARDRSFAVEAPGLDLAQIAVRDLDGTIRLWTRGMERLYGYSSAEAKGKISHQLLKTQFPKPLAAINAELLERGEWSGELQHIHRDGRQITVASQWTVALDNDRENAVVAEVNHDITEHVRVRQHHALLAAVVESSEDAIIIQGLDSTIRSLNPSAERLFGYSAAELIGRPVTLLFPPELVEQEAIFQDKLSRGERVEPFETVRCRKDGSRVEVSLSVSPVHDHAGKMIGAAKIVRDITHQNEMRKQAQDLQLSVAHLGRISTMGQMATLLAHELSQPLAAATNYISATIRIVQQNPADRGRILTGLARAREQAVRTGEIIRNLRSFIMKGVTKRQLIDINTVVRDGIALGALDAAQNGVSIALHLDGNVGEAVIDRVQICQVVVNLVRNAVEAMRDSERRQLTVTTTAADDEMLKITVADTGPGLGYTAERDLFKSFVTSKPGGLGVGLSISRQLVEAHGGRLEAASGPDGGAVFTIYLPSRTDALEDMEAA